jgi:hypothetical protein
MAGRAGEAGVYCVEYSTVVSKPNAHLSANCDPDGRDRRGHDAMTDVLHRKTTSGVRKAYSDPCWVGGGVGGTNYHFVGSSYAFNVRYVYHASCRSL